jgi:hypothetical protein
VTRSFRLLTFAGTLGACSLLEDPTQFVGDGGGGVDATFDAPADGVADVASDAPPPKPGQTLWARSGSTSFLYGVAVGSGGVVIAGIISSPANMGGAQLVNVSATDGVIAQYSPLDGAHMFSSRFGNASPGGSGAVFAYLNVLDYTSEPIIQGRNVCSPTGVPACTSMDVGIGPYPVQGGNDGFIGRFSVSDGKATWIDRLVGPGNDMLVAAASGPTETVFVTGWFDQGTTNFYGAKGSDSMFTNAGDRDIFIAQVNAVGGDVGMVKQLSDPAFEQPLAIAWTGTDLILAGNLAGTPTSFGAPPLTSQGFDWFVMKLKPDGTPEWWVPIGSTADDKCGNMTIDSAGDIYVVGGIAAPMQLGSFSLGGAGGVDIAVVKLKGSDGSVVWAKSFGSATDDEAGGVAVNSAGEVLVSGSITGPITQNGPWNGDSDAIFAAYDKQGNLLWTKIVGTTGTDYGSGVTAASDGFYVLADLGGNIGPTVDGVTIQGAPQPAGLLLKIAP